MTIPFAELLVVGVAAVSIPNWADGMSAWASLLSAVMSTLTFVALVVGAWVGLRRFWRQRVIRSGCATTIEAREVTAKGTRALHVEVSVVNSGAVLLHWVE